jgi:hypothetical protein
VRQWIAWRDAGLNPPPVAVNLSPRQFSDMRLIDDIDAILAETGMDAAYLQLEVTESAAMENPLRTFEMLDALRQRGLHIYIDDFGTGHSNLGQLKRMPIDALKVDKSFVNDVLTDSDDAEIVNATIRLAHALKLRWWPKVGTLSRVVSETEWLRRNSGFVVSKPLPPARSASCLRAFHFLTALRPGMPFSMTLLSAAATGFPAGSRHQSVHRQMQTGRELAFTGPFHEMQA